MPPHKRPKAKISKIPRPDGLASFLADRISLRKALALCKGCEYRMPQNWKQRYDYEAFTHFHGEFECDRCRISNPVSLFLAGEGTVWQEYQESMETEREVRQRELALQQKFPGAILL